LFYICPFTDFLVFACQTPETCEWVQKKRGNLNILLIPRFEALAKPFQSEMNNAENHTRMPMMVCIKHSSTTHNAAFYRCLAVTGVKICEISKRQNKAQSKRLLYVCWLTMCKPTPQSYNFYFEQQKKFFRTARSDSAEPQESVKVYKVKSL